MGYVCPVCGVPQSDAEHLANHLAFTALLGREDHAAWLDEYAPNWRDGGPADLAPVVADRAPERDVETVFEDTTERGHGDAFEDELARHGGYGRDAVGGTTDPETERVLEEARELTRRMAGRGEDDASEEGADEGRADAEGETE